MRFEGELVRKTSGEQLVAKKGNRSSMKGKRRQRRPDCMPSVVQQVFAEGTAGFIPPPEDVFRIRCILDRLKPEDVGLSPKLPYFKNIDARRPSPITYIHVYACDEFSIGIFCLPPNAVIPLHNHPGMTVFIVLSSGERLAKVKTDAVFTATCQTSILYPSSGGNMHCFTAKTACAFLDVLGPPYSGPERNCTYYFDHAYAKYAGPSGFQDLRRERRLWTSSSGSDLRS